MSDFVRILLLLALAGAAVTALVAVAVWSLQEERRVRRALTRVLGGPPEAMLLAHGEGRGAGFSFDTGSIAVAWNTGGWCLVYSLDELMGAELLIDHQVAARAHRGEPRRPLDRTPPDAEAASLRLIFDDARYPDFAISLWPPPDGRKNAPASVREALQEASRWMTRVEAILRRPLAPGPAVVRPEPAPPPRAEPAPWEDDDELDEEDDPRGEGRRLF
jgi:hypothetical protein